MSQRTPIPSMPVSRFVKFSLALSLAFAISAHAAPATYAVNFASSTGDNGSGSFVWDAATSTMTGFSWSFAAGSGGFKDSALAKTIYSPGSARSVGALLFNLMTDPVAYWTTTNGLLSSSTGYFSENFFGSLGALTGTYPPDMLAIDYKKGDAAVSFEMLDLSPSRSVLNAGTLSAAPVPEPGSAALMVAGLAMLTALRRRNPRTPTAA